MNFSVVDFIVAPRGSFVTRPRYRRFVTAMGRVSGGFQHSFRHKQGEAPASLSVYYARSSCVNIEALGRGIDLRFTHAFPF